MGTVLLVVLGVAALVFVGAYLSSGNAGESAGTALGCAIAPFYLLFQLAIYGAGLVLSIMAGAWLLKAIGILS